MPSIKSYLHTAPQRVLGVTAAAWGLSLSAKAATVRLHSEVLRPAPARLDARLGFAISY